MMPPMSRAVIRALMVHACEANDVPDLWRLVTVKWSTRATRAAGIARHSRSRGLRSITLSVPVMSAMTPQQRADTVVHEMCHLIAHEIFGIKIAPHGAEWQACMRHAGYEPTRCHDVSVGPVRRRADTRAFVCRCDGRVHYLGRVRAERAIAYGQFSCRVCGARLTLSRDEVQLLLAKSASLFSA